MWRKKYCLIAQNLVFTKFAVYKVWGTRIKWEEKSIALLHKTVFRKFAGYKVQGTRIKCEEKGIALLPKTQSLPNLLYITIIREYWTGWCGVCYHLPETKGLAAILEIKFEEQSYQLLGRVGVLILNLAF